jgi:hypothetical protein
MITAINEIITSNISSGLDFAAREWNCGLAQLEAHRVNAWDTIVERGLDSEITPAEFAGWWHEALKGKTITVSSSKVDSQEVEHTVNLKVPADLPFPRVGSDFTPIPGKTIAAVKLGVDLFWNQEEKIWEAQPRTTFGGEPVFYIRLKGATHYDYTWRPTDSGNQGVKAVNFTTARR